MAKSKVDWPTSAKSKNNQPTLAQTKELKQSETLDKTNEGRIWSIKCGREFQGPIGSIGSCEIEEPYFDLHVALMNSFAIEKYALLILQGYVMAVIRDIDTGYYVFDSHSRNFVGMPDPSGTAIVMKFSNIIELGDYLHSLSHELNSKCYEIVPVRLKEVSEETETEKQTRLKKTEIEKKERGWKKLKLIENQDSKKDLHVQQKLRLSGNIGFRKTEKERQERSQKKVKLGGNVNLRKTEKEGKEFQI